uniref:Putative methyltransferase n=1 Tax=viral metagenome TaxID=1070528 RepID=A0A6M3JFS9_9ZZZZ
MSQVQETSLSQLYHRVLDLIPTGRTLDYDDKMITDIPDVEVIERRTFILKQCLDKVILDVGCKGSFHAELKAVTKKCYGIDRDIVKEDPDFKQVVIGKDPIPIYEDVEIVVCGEVIEHLSNPGMFLDELRTSYPTQMKIISVPNAFSNGHQGWIKKGQENTNKDHVAYYTYVTLKGLLSKHGYKIEEFYWYDNPEHIQIQGLNEGMVVVTV